MSNWMQALQNQKGTMLKQFLVQLLQDRLTNYDELIDRLSTVMVTDGDMTKFSQMTIDLYEKGYLRAVQDHSEELKKLGIKVQIVPKKNPVDSQIGLHESAAHQF